MNKNGTSRTKYCIQWETHANNIFKGFCSLMEHQSLVDIVLCCGNNTIQAHKVVLAANSPLFREEFEKNPQIEQVIIHGCEFGVLRSAVEIMYCGRTVITEEMVRHFIAAARLFQLRILDNLFLHRPDFLQTGEEVFLPKPQFLTKKPKYPTYSFGAQPAPGAVPKPLAFGPGANFKPYKQKKKLRLEAEQACVKEAHASRMALASLQKEIAAAPQVNNFIIEESCTETTVENFIPHQEQQPSYVQVIEYTDLENGVYLPSGEFIPDSKPPVQLSSERIKHLLGADLPANVEVMYKTSDGSFVAVTEEVLRTLSSKEGLQYQVVDEDGRVGEIQDLQMLDRVKASCAIPIEIDKVVMEDTDKYRDETTSATSSNDCVIVDNDREEDMELEPAASPRKCDTKFSPDIFFADLPVSGVDVSVEIVGATKVEKVDDGGSEVVVS